MMDLGCVEGMPPVSPGEEVVVPPVRPGEEVAGSCRARDASQAGMEGPGPGRAEDTGQTHTDGGIKPRATREAAGSGRAGDVAQTRMDGGIEPEVTRVPVEVVDVLASGATEGEDARGAPLTVALPARPQYTVEHP